MSAALPIPLIQLLQVLTVAIGAPGITGVIAKVEARLQGRRGPRIRQPYYDLAKLFRKEALAPEGASWFFLAAPLIAVAAYLTIPLIAVGKLPGGGKGAGTRREPKGRSAVWTGLFPPDPPQARGTSDEGRRRRESGPEASGSTE